VCSFDLPAMFRLLSLRQHALRTSLAPRAFSSTVPRPSAAASQETLTDGEKTIIEKLTDRFSPSDLVVKDVSGKQSYVKIMVPPVDLIMRNRWMWDILRYYHSQ
jgi:hypothetical protein